MHDASEELLSSLSTLIMDPFGSHVLRALLNALAPSPSSSSQHKDAAARSKKSAAFKARQGSMKSVLSEQENGSGRTQVERTPKRLKDVALKMVLALRDRLGENEVRALASDKVASPALQVSVTLSIFFVSSPHRVILLDNDSSGMRRGTQ